MGLFDKIFLNNKKMKKKTLLQKNKEFSNFLQDKNKVKL